MAAYDRRTSNCSINNTAIINRGGEQGAQHSQALHSWFCHIPGIKVVMPYSPNDARDLLIASVLDNNPVIYHDDRWLYENESEYKKPKENFLKLSQILLRKVKILPVVGLDSQHTYH